MSEKKYVYRFGMSARTSVLRRLCRTYQKSLYKGEIHALIGENGSGKSTLTNMLTGIYTLETGKFILDGKKFIRSQPGRGQ
jgi:ABC-type uncharacterized transport system ATPase subunit